MCSPVGHSLAGYILYLAWNRNYKLTRDWKKIVLYLFAANGPDLDFIPGIFVGDTNRFHHGISHTLGFSILFALGMYTISKFRTKKDFMIFFLLYFTHLLIDCLTADSSAPFGVMLFWPFTRRYFMSSCSLFFSIHHRTLSDLFDLHNIRAMSWEAAVFFSIITLLVLAREIRKNKESLSVK
ncbi:hypothetical protein ES703_33768 [subsurface metagenome]